MSYQLPNRASDAGPRYETFRAPDEPLRCGSCRARVAALAPCTWDADLRVGACCAADEETSPYVPPILPLCTRREMARQPWDARVKRWARYKKAVSPATASMRAEVGRASEAISKKEVA